MNDTHFISSELDDLKKKGLYRQLKAFQQVSDPWVTVGGKRCLLLCSNNYLGLAGHPYLKECAQKATERYGCSAAASRLISGNLELYPRLEKKIADFKRVEDVLLFSSGYLANLGLITSLCGPGDLILCDRLNHASIIDACILSRAVIKRYPHNDLVRLEQLLQDKKGYRRRLIVSEAVFSMEGDILPLPQLSDLAEKYETMLLVDEAHALGVLGERGRGVEEYFGRKENPYLIRMATLGKALGSFGAFAAGNTQLIAYLTNKARSFIYTTALPPGVLAASLASFELLEQGGERLKRLGENADFLRRGLQGKGFETLNSSSPIIPVLIGDHERTLLFSRRLFEAGIFVQAIRPPTVPLGRARLRVTVMALHSRQELIFALDTFSRIGKELGIIG